MNNDVSHAIDVLSALLKGKPMKYEDLIKFIKENLLIIPALQYCDKDIFAKDIAHEYERIYGSKTFINDGTTIVDKEANDAWFYEKKSKINNFCFTDRYKKYLETEKFGENAINSIISSTEKVLSYCADPTSSDKKKGLVIGDVQSGKTSNYLALANMACDYGYKIILILAGLTDSLRKQTQERVDEGFVGAISSTIKDELEPKYVGVGLNEQKHYAVTLTTDLEDFKGNSASFTDLNKPAILVVKKNKNILSQVKKWLKPGQHQITSRNILIIDDECDNASVNTKTDDDPSTINALIRDIYNNFECASYVGFTATPFANIFINSDSSGYDDLFPSNFIHRLHANPESYFGVNKVFPGNDIESNYIVKLDESEKDFISVNHKKDIEIRALPNSLKDSICYFLLCNCIRTLRGDGKKHRSMMINVSRFNNVQDDLKDLVELYIHKLDNSIFQKDKFPIDRMLKDPEMKRLYDIYNNHSFFSKPKNNNEPLNKKYTFETLIKNSLLYDEISKFIVTVVSNKYKGDMRFDYDKYEDTGARVICIGGFILSRGLTLNGLMTSYYSRNATAYDTLLQMCRWFGYRPNYEDLCSIFISDLNIQCFDAVIDAINNLDKQIKMMNDRGQTPNDFGLMIRESPETLETNLLITARNKSKNTTVLKRNLNFGGVTIDTSKLFIDYSYNIHNKKEIDKLFENLSINGYEFKKEENKDRYMFRNVDPIYVSEFIAKIKIPLQNKKFDTDNISDFIKNNSYYDKWDIVIATGEKVEGESRYEIYGEKLPLVHRKFDQRPDENIIRISKGNNRLLDPGIFNSGLNEQQILYAKNNAKKDNRKNLIAEDYLDVPNRNPLLVILPIKLKLDSDEKETLKQLKQNTINGYHGPLFGFGIGFAGREDKVYMTYRLNKVKQEEYLKMHQEDEIDD